jgi:hypothetical protein
MLLKMFFKENVFYMHNGVLFRHKEHNCVICRKMNGTEDQHVNQNPDSESPSIP